MVGRSGRATVARGRRVGRGRGASDSQPDPGSQTAGDASATDAGSTAQSPQTGVTSSDQSTSDTPQASATASSSGRGAKKTILAQPKFAGRRSKAARDAAEASQAARRVEEEKPERIAREPRGGRRDSAQRGNRGGFMGDHRRSSLSTAPVGVFGSGLVSAEQSLTRRTNSGVARSSGPTGSTSRQSNRRARLKTEGADEEGKPIYVDISSDESEDDTNEGPKRNIDYIDLRSDSEGEDAEKKPGEYGSRGMQPVRVQRVERRDRTKPSIADHSKVDRKKAIRDLEQSHSSSKGKQRASNEAPDDPQHEWKGVYEDDNDDVAGVDIKQEPPTADDTAMTGTIAPIPSSPEDRKVRARKHSEPDLQTEEERSEHRRHIDDLDTILHELRQTSILDNDGDIPMHTEGTQAKGDPRAYKVYLFQFPPILPDLRAAPEVTVKQEPEAASPTLTKAVPSSETLPDTAAIKIDPDEEPESSRGGPTRLSPGKVGKLRVHESGKVTLDWGGTSLAVGMGTDVQFLQQVVMAKVWDGDRTERHVSASSSRSRNAGTTTSGDPEAKSDVRQPDGFVGGEVMALGQVRGKFVVTPDWDEII